MSVMELTAMLVEPPSEPTYTTMTSRVLDVDRRIVLLLVSVNMLVAEPSKAKGLAPPMLALRFMYWPEST